MMITIQLILPLVLLGLLLIMGGDSRRFGFLLSICGVLITTFFLYDYIINPANDSSYYTVLYFDNIKDVMTIIFCLSFILGISFILPQALTNYKEVGSIFIYFACSMGIIFSEDLITLFIYWESVAVMGAFIVAMGSSFDSKKIALKYFCIHALGGVILLVGIIAYVLNYGTSSIEGYKLNLSDPFNYFILIGILVNLGLPPLASWIIDGYSKCSHNASIFLSIFTTKSALFVLFNLFYNVPTLVYFGVALALYGIVFSIIENNARKILAYSIIHQIGIVVISIAISDYKSNSFAISYVVINILYKMILFMVLVILYNNLPNHSDDIYKIRNSINIKSILGLLVLISAVQSLGLPLSGGFVAKTYLSWQVGEQSMLWLSYFMFFAASCTALNVGIRLPYMLLNFKNTAQEIPYKTRIKFIPLFIIIVLLEAIFVANSKHFLNLANILHSLQVTALGIVLFLICHFVLQHKEEIISHKINSIRDSFYGLVMKFFYNIARVNLNTIIVRIASSTYTKVTSFDYSKQHYSHKLSIVTLITIIVFYLVLKVY